MSGIKSAQSVLTEIRDGRMLVELAEEFHAAIEAVRMHNKEAKVVLTVTIAPWKGDHKLIEPPIILTGEVSSKLPKETPEATVFFVDSEGNAVRNQQRQPELGLTIAAQSGSQQA